MMLLRLRQKARQTIQKSPPPFLDRLLHHSPSSEEFKETMTMALYTCTYKEYEDWRQTQLRIFFPRTVHNFLSEYAYYTEFSKKLHDRYIMLEKHFSFLQDPFQTFVEMAPLFLYEEYIQSRRIQFLYMVSDALLEFRRHGHKATLTPLAELLELCFLSPSPPTLSDVWESVFLRVYDQHTRWGKEQGIENVEQHLQREFEIGHVLLSTVSFYRTIRRNVLHRIHFSWPMDTVWKYPRVLEGLLEDRPTDFIEAWELDLQRMGKVDPWKAVGRSRQLLEYLERNHYPILRTAVDPSFQSFVEKYRVDLLSTWADNHSLDLRWIIQHVRNPDTWIRVLIQHLWKHQRMRQGYLLMESREDENKTVWLPLKAFLFDVYASISNGMTTFRDTLALEENWPCRGIEDRFLPRYIVHQKILLKERYQHFYPDRKLAWLDWHSTVELTNGWTMPLVHFLVLRFLKHRERIETAIIGTHFAWEREYVEKILESLQPLWVERERGCWVRAALEHWPTPEWKVVLPVVGAPTCTKMTTPRSLDDHRYAMEARIVRCLKREGPMAWVQFAHRLELSETILRPFVEGLQSKEYVLCKDDVLSYLP